MDLTAVYATSNGSAAGYDKDDKTFNGDMTDYDAVLFVKVNTKYYAYNIRSLNDVAISSTDYVAVKNSDGKVIAAYVELASKPSGSTSDTVYGIVSANKGIVKVNGDDQKAYVVSNNTGDYTVYMPTTATIDEGDIVWFEKTSDDVYGNGDVHKVVDETNYAGGIYVKEMDKGNVLSFYTSVSNTSNGYVGNNLKNIALDTDAQIVYVNQDGDKAGNDIGVNGFDEITGYANAAIVLNNSGKIVAVIVETSNKCDILSASKLDVSGGPLTESATETITVNILNTGLTGTTFTGELSNASGVVSDVTVTVTDPDVDGKLVVSLAETTNTALAAGTYTLTVKDSGSSIVGTYTVAI